MNVQDQERTLVIQPRRALFFLGGAGILMVVLSFITHYLRLHPESYNIRYPYQADLLNDLTLEFNFNGANNIVVYFSVLILNIAAGLLFVAAHFKKEVKDDYRVHWTALAWIVLFFAIDTLAGIHGKFQLYFEYSAVMSSKYAWMIVWIAGTVILSLLFLRFWLHLDKQYRILFLASAVLYLAGILGKEMTQFSPSQDFVYSLFLTIEQGLQYGGATLLIYSLLLYIPSFSPRFFVATKDLTDERK